MRPGWDIIALVAGFAFAGGWLAVRAAKALAGRTLPLAAAVVVCGLLAAWTVHVVFGTTAILASLCLAWALLVLSIVDWLDFRLPDVLTLPLILAGVAASLVMPAEHALDHAAAAAVAFAALWAIAWAYERLRHQEGLGLGDAKLGAAAGAWLGFEPLPSVLLLASVAGIVWILVGSVTRGREALAERIPFGVPLSLAIWIVWLYNPLPVAAMA